MRLHPGSGVACGPRSGPALDAAFSPSEPPAWPAGVLPVLPRQTLGLALAVHCVLAAALGQAGSWGGAQHLAHTSCAPWPFG